MRPGIVVSSRVIASWRCLDYYFTPEPKSDSSHLGAARIVVLRTNRDAMNRVSTNFLPVLEAADREPVRLIVRVPVDGRVAAVQVPVPGIAAGD